MSSLFFSLKIFEALEKISSHEIKQELESNGQEALEKGIFGVPTLVMDGNLFWGLDSTEMAIEYLSDPQLFGSPEMKRLETLPGYWELNNKLYKVENSDLHSTLCLGCSAPVDVN